jgi:hypothetical protein
MLSPSNILKFFQQYRNITSISLQMTTKNIGICKERMEDRAAGMGGSFFLI